MRTEQTLPKAPKLKRFLDEAGMATVTAEYFHALRGSFDIAPDQDFGLHPVAAMSYGSLRTMKFRFIWVGRTRDRNWLALQDEYLRRLSHFVRTEIVEIRDGNRESEGKLILDKLNQSHFVCILDVKGRSVGSHELAKEIEKWQNKGLREVSFVIGGADGLSPAVVERADFSLSLSFLTFTHEMARVVMLEQIYRAYTIIKGFPYQK